MKSLMIIVSKNTYIVGQLHIFFSFSVLSTLFKEWVFEFSGLIKQQGELKINLYTTTMQKLNYRGLHLQP